MPSVVTLVFAGIAVSIVLLVRSRFRQASERKKRRAQFPGEPWMWRQDWADHTVRDTHELRAWFLWLFGIVWILISLPMVFVYRGKGPAAPEFWFAGLFPVVGMCVLIAAFYMTLRQHKYGVSFCRLDRLPVPVGGQLRAEVDARVTEIPPSGFQVRLTCVRRTITGSGKSRSVHERVLWEDEQVVGSGQAMPASEGMRVPVRFAIPATAEPTDETDSRDSILWRLDVAADVPGIDYRTRFELPVFRGAEGDASSRSEFVHNVATTEWTPPASIEFAMSRTGGEELTVHPSARPFDSLAYIFFFIVWFGTLEMMRRFGVTPWALVPFVLIGLLIFALIADLLIRRTTISADRTTLLVRHSWFGVPRNTTVAASDVESLLPHIGMTSGNRVFYDIDAVLRGGKKLTVAKNLRSRRDAEGLSARITHALGR